MEASKYQFVFNYFLMYTENKSLVERDSLIHAAKQTYYPRV